jgi:hypothetical protein
MSNRWTARELVKGDNGLGRGQGRALRCVARCVVSRSTLVLILVRSLGKGIGQGGKPHMAEAGIILIRFSAASLLVLREREREPAWPTQQWRKALNL